VDDGEAVQCGAVVLAGLGEQAGHVFLDGAGRDVEAGSIEAGKKADFILLNSTLSNTLTENEEIQVSATFINGQQVF